MEQSVSNQFHVGESIPLNDVVLSGEEEGSEFYTLSMLCLPETFHSWQLPDELFTEVDCSLRENVDVSKANAAWYQVLAGGKVDEEYINGLMEQPGIADRQKHTPTQLSGGPQQRGRLYEPLPMIWL